MNNLNFRISSHLKSIIWKELITNKYVAIFELVKNAYDASASKVEVIFEDEKIIISDNGKWMSINDIKNKWLIVWYSAKANDTENNWYINYRNKISPRKSLAGAKGVWRFACDRLGSKLILTTLKDEPNAKFERLNVDWDLFEKDWQEDFINIDVQHQTLENYVWLNNYCGTAIEINALRETWSSEDVLETLTRHLSRLISPYNSKDDFFEIYLTYNWNRIKIENFIFENLNIKTTKITVEISHDWKEIITEITDRWERIYKLVENNEFEKILYWIKFTLYYLTRSSKDFFAKKMGVRTFDYGAVSLYRNWFRVYPFWEPWEDSFGLDQRKNQWRARYLGTRDLIWMIEINNQSNEFRETSSRSWWLVETTSYKLLQEFFKNFCIKRFETYVVDTLDWIYKLDDDVELFPIDREWKIKELLEKLIKTKAYKSLEYGYWLEEKLHEKANVGYVWAKEKIQSAAKKTWNKELDAALKSIDNTIKRKDEEITDIQKKNQQLEKQNISLMGLTTEEFDNLISYHHQISICSDTIDNYIDLIFQKIQRNDYSKIEDYLQKIKKENSRIVSIAWFATKNGVKEKATKKKRDLVAFIRNYIYENWTAVSRWKISFNIEWKDSQFLFEFRPFDIAVVFDNLIKNSRIAWATKVSIEIYGDDKNLSVVFTDNWSGFNKQIINLHDIFQKKYSTTEGSWWWLYHVQQILNELNSTINAERLQKGAKFIINFTKV